tara:strand:+ start:36 stop:488 length:453 start_codon:yes stop_codon:yes gene_type:complete
MIKKLIKEFWQISGEFDSSDIKKSFVNNLHIDNDEVGSFMLDVLEKEIGKTTNEKLLNKMETLQDKITKYERFPYEEDLVNLLGRITLMAQEISSAGRWLNKKSNIPTDLKEKVDNAFINLYTIFEEMAEDIASKLNEQEKVDRESYMHG